jgi:hypothetical protein
MLVEFPNWCIGVSLFADNSVEIKSDLLRVRPNVADEVDIVEVVDVNKRIEASISFGCVFLSTIIFLSANSFLSTNSFLLTNSFLSNE